MYKDMLLRKGAQVQKILRGSPYSIQVVTGEFVEILNLIHPYTKKVTPFTCEGDYSKLF